MSILLKEGKATLSPPKCGTHTINKVMQSLGPTLLTGHMWQEDAIRHLQRQYPHIAPDEFQWGMNVRDPIDRFVSSINHQFAERKENLDYIYEELVMTRRLKLFSPMYKYLERCKNILLFKFEDFEICRWLGWKDPIPHELPGEYRWSRERVLGHKHFPKALEPYLPDFKLRECVL